MPPALKVSISNHVIDRLKNAEDGAAGSLFGHLLDNSLVVIGFGVHCSDLELDQWNSVPSEVQVCGAFTLAEHIHEAETCLANISKRMDVIRSPLLLTSVKGDIQSHLVLDGTPTKVSFSTVNSTQLASIFTYFRLKGEFLINCEKTQQSITTTFEELKKKVLSKHVAFLLLTKKLFLAGTTPDKISGDPAINADHRVKDLFDSQPERSSKDFDVLPVKIHLKQTKELGHGNVQSFVPIIRHVRRSFKSIDIVVRVDSLALVHRNAKIATLFNALSNSFVHGLRQIESNLLEQLASGSHHSISIPETYHFLPAQSSFFISTVYPKSSPDADLKKQRELLHRSFGFGLDQPLFRRSQSYKFPGEGVVNGPLTNPHEGLNSGVKGGQASLVKGLYSYHHYMQDRFDDNGWGCAYRSLQTVVSWFRLQGYTEVPVPTHKQIQECLVKIGDKPSSFIGSRQWIGSTEVSFVLETLLGVTCKILTASTGEEVGTLGSELAYHFQTHGTPIMIGGGVLAHTIIGVDYNRSTGDIKFLILDPHYTGGEDLGIITSKGWVGWKDIKFWTKNAFYNLCLPLRPVGDI